MGVKYNSISPNDFSCNSIIIFFNSEGELIFQKEVLALDYKTTVEMFKKQLE